MLKQTLIQKVGWLVSASSLGLCLGTSAHAGEVRMIAQADTRHAITLVKDEIGKFPMYRLSGEEALLRGKRLMQRARTPRQHRAAFAYLSYAANKGIPEAQFQCAIMYLDNQYIPANDTRAMSLLERASEQGHEQAGIALEYIRFGDDGIGC
jgi:TPR repeat protein